MTSEKLQKYRENFIESLEESVYRKEVNAAFDATRIPEVENLKLKLQTEHDENEKKIAAIDPNDKTKETRQKRKAIEFRQKQIEEKFTECDETVVAIKTAILKADDEAKFFRLRIEFAKMWEPLKVEEERKSPKPEEQIILPPPNDTGHL